MTTVYRIEHPVTGVGPWDSEWNENLTNAMKRDVSRYRSLLNSYIDLDVHPCARVDFINFKAGMYCGCTSKREFKRWFFRNNEFVSAAKDAGYDVLILSVDHIAIHRGDSGRQVAFYPDRIRSRRTISIAEFLQSCA